MVRRSNDPYVKPNDQYVEPSTPSSNPGSFGFPSFYPVPLPHWLTNSEVKPIIPTLEADPVSSSGGFGVQQNLGLQSGESQGYSPNFEAQYPSSEKAQHSSEETGPTDYNSVNAVQPSSSTSLPFESTEVPVFSGASAYWAQAAPIETPAFPSYGSDVVLDSTSSKVASQPSRFHKVAPQLPSTHQLATPQEKRMSLPSTYIVQSSGRYGRGRNVNRNTRYYHQGPPPASFGLKRQRRRKAWSNNHVLFVIACWCTTANGIYSALVFLGLGFNKLKNENELYLLWLPSINVLKCSKTF